MNIKRYDWEDALIEAESLGLLEAGAVNMCLRLAKAINWDSKGKHAGKPSGLYWKNEDALRAVGSSRATYFRYRRQLFTLGFFTEEKGNLLPCVPDLSQVETTQSQVETTESQIDTPYSEDTYSEDSVSENEPVDADASPVPSNYTYMGSLKVEDFGDLDYLANSVGVAAFDALGNGVQDAAQSQIETSGLKRILSPGEKKDFARAVRVHRATETQAAEALTLLQTTGWSKDIYVAATDALRAVGAVVEEVEVW